MMTQGAGLRGIDIKRNLIDLKRVDVKRFDNVDGCVNLRLDVGEGRGVFTELGFRDVYKTEVNTATTPLS